MHGEIKVGSIVSLTKNYMPQRHIVVGERAMVTSIEPCYHRITCNSKHHCGGNLITIIGKSGHKVGGCFSFGNSNEFILKIHEPKKMSSHIRSLNDSE